MAFSAETFGALDGKIGEAGGIASLNENGKVPESQLPSYVDDVVNGYYYDGAFYEDAEHTQEMEPETGKVYVDLSTNISYRWSGMAYTPLANPNPSASSVTYDNTGSGLAADDAQDAIDELAGDAVELKSALKSKMSDSELKYGYKEYPLVYAHGWINSSGVYNPSATQFLSNVVSTNGLKEFANNSSKTVYALYMSSYTSLESFTLASISSIAAGSTHIVNTNYPYVVFESEATNTADLSGLVLSKDSIVGYLSIESIGEMDGEISRLSNDFSATPVIEKRFNVDAGESHSSTLDKIHAEIKAGDSYCVITNHGAIYAFHPDGTYDFLSNSGYIYGIASENFSSFGISWENDTGAADEVRFAVVHDFANTGVFDWLKNYRYSKYHAYPIYKKLDNNLKSGSLQANLVVAELANAVGYTKKIPTNGCSQIIIQPLPIYDGVSAYKYRFIEYKEDGTYQQVAFTEATKDPYTFTVHSSYVYFAFGIYAVDGSGNNANVNLYNLIDVPISLYYVGIENAAFAGLEVIPNIVNDVVHSTDIIDLNPNIEDKLYQARRPINLSASSYLNQLQPVTLLHFSDIHGDITQLKRLIRIANKYNLQIDDVICTGDIVADRWASDFTFWGDTNGAEDILIAIGNHDVLTDPSGYDWSQRATQSEQYNRYIAPFVEKWDVEITSGNTYYYKDYSANKIRLIVLNCMLTGTDDINQLSWLETVLADAKANDMHVIVADHYPIAGAEKIDCRFTSLDKNVIQSDVLPTTYTETVISFISTGGKFICYIAGHNHLDFIVKDPEHDNQICVVIDAASLEQGNIYSDTQRTEGLRSEDLANLITLDTSSKTIKIVRVGANMDHYLREKNVIAINYETGIVITES